MPHGALLFWMIFGVVVLGMLGIDLLVFHRRAHAVKIKEALIWSAVWIGVALLFCAGVYFWRSKDTALLFLTAYVLEKSLSVDNLFVFIVLFSYFGIGPQYQHRVLFWGIMGALILRGVFIFAGVALIEKFHWTVLIFGLILIVTGVRLVFKKDDDVHPEKNPILRLFRKFFPVSGTFNEQKFFTRENGKLLATPMLVALVAIESTDVVFATDSVPAVLAISTDPFVAYTSNIFAILGLRALYFAVAGVLKYLRYLNYGLALVLVFIGAKMVLVNLHKFAHLEKPVFKIPVGLSLAIVLGILLLSALASLVAPHRAGDAKETEGPAPAEGDKPRCGEPGEKQPPGSGDEQRKS
jgi:tellurite resistance protein TerC